MKKIYDIIGIGIGPFNLGLAALLCAVPDVASVFFDSAEMFDWHPGLMIEGTRLQVPFYADLVTLADPCSPFSYLSFLKAGNRLFRFAIHEQNFPTRKEYNQYCRWVCSKLDNLRFNHTCVAIRYDEQDNMYQVRTFNAASGKMEVFHAKHIVLGTGTVPRLPQCARDIRHPAMFHSGKYLLNKKLLETAKDITIIGSGQSAAEIFFDQLNHRGNVERLNWFTRSARFFPMEYSKLTLEMTSPDYIDYFFKLPADKKATTLKTQDALYKGINFSLVNEIYDKLYVNSLEADALLKPNLFPACELPAIKIINKKRLRLAFVHTANGQTMFHETNCLVMATGYGEEMRPFIEPLRPEINFMPNGTFDVARNYSIDKRQHVFVQNADLHSHGFNSADLGMGPYRNACIINAILQKEYYKLESNIAFQHFNGPVQCKP